MCGTTNMCFQKGDPDGRGGYADKRRVKSLELLFVVEVFTRRIGRGSVS
jgi:hypothetical protein